MAENDENEKPQMSEDKKPESTTDAPEGTVKKATKKKAAKKAVVKKKVVRKRAVTKKVVAKKAAVTAASDTDALKAGESSQEKAVGSVPEKETAVVAAAAGELSDVGKSEAKAEPPVAVGQVEISREEKVTMSAEATKSSKTTGSSGFLPKVIIWLVVVIAAFMYIRSMVHDGQTVTQKAKPAASAVSESNRQDSSSPAGLVSIKPSAGTESAVAKIGTVAVEKQPEQKISSANISPTPIVPVVPSKAEPREADKDAAVLSAQQETEVAKSEAVTDSPVAAPVATAPSEPQQPETKVTEESKPAPDAVGSSSSPVQVTETAASDAPVPGGEQVVSGTVQETEQQAPVSVQAVVEAEQQQETAGKMPEVVVETVSTAGSDNLAEAPTAPKSQEAAPPVSEAMVAAPEPAGTDYSARAKRPSFKELFGYERPQPPVRRYDYRSYSDEGLDTPGAYPAPWQYAPVRPGWGAEYPGQYWPYGNYGGYPSYPAMPDWAPYLPYGYGPSGY